MGAMGMKCQEGITELLR